MHPIAYIMLVSISACLVGIILLLHGWKRTRFLRAVPILILTLLLMMLFYAAALFEEWSGLGEAKRWNYIEDLASVFLPFTWAFMFYTLVKNSVENSLRITRDRFRNLVESTSDWTWEVDAKGRYTYVGPQIEHLLGYRPEDMLGKKPFDFMPPDEANRVAANYADYAAKRKPFVQLENINLHKDGHEVILETTGSPVVDRDGTLIGYRGVDRDITRRKLAERDTAERQAELKSVFTASPVGIALVRDRKLISSNDRFLDISGYSEEELRGVDPQMLYLSPMDYDAVGRKYEQAGTEGMAAIETRWVRADNVIIDVMLYLAPLDTAEPDKGFTVVVQDITEFKAAQKEVEEEKSKAQLYLDVAGAIIVVLDTTGHVKLLNKRGCELLGCTFEEATGVDWFLTFVPVSYRAITRNAFARLMRGEGQSIEYFENPILTGEGKERLISWHNVLLKDENGKITSVISSGEDVTEARAAERAVYESEERLRVALSAANMGTWRYVPDTNRFTRSASLNSLLGLVSAESTQSIEDFYNYVFPEDRDHSKQELDRAINQNNMYFARFRIVQPGTGQVRWVMTQGKPFYDYNGKLDYVTGVLIDVTERTQAEQALRESEARLRILFDQGADPIYLSNTDGQLVQVNWQACKDTGYTQEELLGMNVIDIDMRFSNAEELREFQKSLIPNQPVTFESSHKRKDGSVFPVEITASCLETPEGTFIMGIVRDITERKETQIALTESEQRYRNFIKLAAEGIARFEFEEPVSLKLPVKEQIDLIVEHGILAECNDLFAQMYGYKNAEAFVGARIFDLWNDPDVANEVATQLIEAGYQWTNIETRETTQAGVEKYFLNNMVSIIENDHLTSQWLSQIDITEEVANRKALQESEERFRNIVNSSPMGILTYFLESDSRLVLTGANAASKKILKRDFSSYLNKTVEDVFPQLAGSEIAENYRRICREGGVYQRHNYEYQDGHVDGVFEFVAFQTSPCKMATLFLDVTERVRTQKALQFTQFAIDHAGEASYWMNPDATIFYVNEAACKSLGYSREELLQMSVFDLDPDINPEQWEEIWKHTRTHGTHRVESRHKAKDGRIFPIEINGSFLVYEGKEYSCAFVRDISERKAAEEVREALLKQLQFTQFAVDHANEEAYWMGPDANFVYVNEQACNKLGYTRDELLTMGVPEIDPDFPKDIWPNHWKELREKKALRFDSHHKTKDGHVFPVEISANYVTYDNHEYVCAFARDISERRIAEQTRELLMQQLTERNDELQSIVFTAAHDLRSPLVNIDGFTGELEKGLKQLGDVLTGQPLTEEAAKKINYLFESDMAESLRFIKSGSQQMDLLLNGLMRLSRVGSAPLAVSALDMKDLLETVVEGLQYQIQEYEVEISIQPDLPECEGDATLLNQVFTNLVDNAIKYRHPERPAVIEIRGAIRDDIVEYAVADNGIGIDETEHEKVFDLFHRLHPKHRQDGQGLGLTIVRRILDRMHGSVRMESTPGLGTTVYVRLPRV